jgi:formylglycine-generating enzyme required for sulfatase activity
MGMSEAEIKEAVKTGADKDWVNRSGPQHTVELADYQIGRFPITNLEYAAFVKGSGHDAPRGWDGEDYPEGKGDHPVVQVTWQDAQAYCAWLREKTGKAYGLPSEAQWEKAARGTDGRAYPWGSTFDVTRANVSESQIGDTTPVGKYGELGASPYGAEDMAGNVWEWCNSVFKEYPYDAADGREDADDQSGRALRGGSWNDDAAYARCADRSLSHPGGGDVNVGFRVAVSPSRTP